MDPRETDAGIAEVLYSQYESIPAIAAILNVFLDSLPTTLAGMKAARDGGDGAALASLAHQIKGAGGGYGYPAISEAAANVEKAAGEMDWELVNVHLAILESLCAAALRGRKSPAGENA